MLILIAGCMDPFYYMMFAFLENLIYLSLIYLIHKNAKNILINWVPSDVEVH